MFISASSAIVWSILIEHDWSYSVRGNNEVPALLKGYYKERLAALRPKETVVNDAESNQNSIRGLFSNL